VLRQASTERHLSRRVHTKTGLKHVTNNHIGDVVAIKMLEHRFGGGDAEVHGTHVFEATHERPKRYAFSSGDDDAGHCLSLIGTPVLA
jgi:hypothetical protein